MRLDTSAGVYYKTGKEPHELVGLKVASQLATRAHWSRGTT